jgi:dienelactone hydrolase
LRQAVTREDALGQALEDYQRLDHRIGGGPITVLGFSFGAYIATYVAAYCQPQRLVLRSPALYPDEGWTVPKEELDEQALEAYRKQFHEASSNGALRCCAKFKGDVLLVDSENDEVIPRTVIASYEAAFGHARSFTRHTLQSADHPLTESSWQKEYQKVVLEWLRKHPNESPPA